MILVSVTYRGKDKYRVSKYLPPYEVIVEQVHFLLLLISLHLDLRILRIACSVPVLLHLRMQELFGHDGMSNYNDLSTSL